MIILTLSESSWFSLNTSLQVGDLIYSCSTLLQSGAETEQFASPDSNGAGVSNIVGVLRNIDTSTVSGIKLYVDNSMLNNIYIPLATDFIMFSKYSQGDSGILGYYADVKLINNSRKKAEIFSVGSEVIINSK